MMELQSLGQYRIEAEIDSSWAAAQLRVRRCRAVDTVRKRPVLLSLFERGPDCGLDESGLLRLLDQTLPASDLVHPRLGWEWEAGEIDGQYYLAERAVQGQTLAQRLAESGPLSWAEAQTAVEQVAKGLDYAHGRGWTHGALTPAIVWLSAEMGAIISGWGLQRGLQALHLEAPAGEARRALTPYLAPERLAGAAPSPAADQYGLACLWYEMLTGQPLFPPTSPEALEAQRQAGPVFPPAWPEETPWEIEPALERGAAAAPSSRYPTASDLAATPARLAAEMPGAAEERARRAALARQRQEAAEQVRRQAEEAHRLSALNQARKEIEEQVQRASQASLRLNDAPDEMPAETEPAARQAPESGALPADQAAEAADLPEHPTAATPQVAGAEGLPDAESAENAPAEAAPAALADGAALASVASAVTGILEAGGPGHRGVTRKAGPAAGSSTKAAGDRLPVTESHSAIEAPAPVAPLMTSEGTVAPVPLPTGTAVSGSAGAEIPLVEAPRPDVSRPAPAPEQAPRWILWAGLVVAALLFGGLWWSSPAGGGVTETPTATAPAASATLPAETQAVLPGVQLSPSPLATTAAAPTRPAATPTPTVAAATKTPAATQAASATSTPSRTPTATLTPSETAAPGATATRRILPTSTRDPNKNRENRD